MKMSTSKFAAAVAVVFGMAVAVSAATPGNTLTGGRSLARTAGRGPAAAQHAVADPGEIAQLKQAFDLLVGADHDYQGHRVKAMAAIARACKLMGTDIVPPGLKERLEKAGGTTQPNTTPPAAKPHGKKEPETQSTSDAQLKEAQGIVQQVVAGIPAGTQPRISELLTKANEELTTALSIK